MNKEQSLVTIQRAVGRLNADELEVLATIAERLEIGQHVYGELDLKTDQRNFADEAYSEFVDGAIYTAIRLLKLRRGTEAAPLDEVRRSIY